MVKCGCDLKGNYQTCPISGRRGTVNIMLFTVIHYTMIFKRFNKTFVIIVKEPCDTALLFGWSIYLHLIETSRRQSMNQKNMTFLSNNTPARVNCCLLYEEVIQQHSVQAPLRLIIKALTNMIPWRTSQRDLINGFLSDGKLALCVQFILLCFFGHCQWGRSERR